LLSAALLNHFICVQVEPAGIGDSDFFDLAIIFLSTIRTYLQGVAQLVLASRVAMVDQ